jgi:hypothetical protein
VSSTEEKQVTRYAIIERLREEEGKNEKTEILIL